MATFMMSIGRSFSIEPGGADETYDAWDAHPALSMPAIRQVGRDLVNTMASWFEHGREHRLDTLGVQVERAIRISGKDALASVAETPAFSEWAEGASKVDLRDRAMADVWQAALLSLQMGGVGRLRMLDLARRMKPDEATAFRSIALKKGIPSGAEIKRLQALGLVKHNAERMFNRGTLFMYLSLFSLTCFAVTAMVAMPALFPALAAALDLTPLIDKIHGMVRMPTSLAVVVVGSLMTSIPMLMHLVLDSPDLTEDGLEMAAALRAVSREPEPKAAAKPVRVANVAMAG